MTSAVDPAPAGAMSGLFGRGLLYVAVASVPFLSAVVVSPVLAYQLGPRGFGLMAAAIAVHQLLLVVSIVGLDQALVLQRAEDGDDRAARGLIAAGIAIAAATTLMAGVAGPLWSRALGFAGFDGLVLATVLWTLPAVTVQLTLALLMAQDRLRAFSWVTLLSTVGSQLVGLVLLFTVGKTAEVYAWGGVGGQVLAMAVGVALTRPDWRGLVDVPVFRRSLQLGIPLMLAGLSAIVLSAGDRLVIQRLLGPAETGRYQVAYTVGFVAVTVLTLTGHAWGPRIAAVRDDAERWALIGRSRDELYRALAPIILGVVLGAPLLLRLVAPSSFEPTRLLPVVLLVVLSAVPVVAGLASSRALITARRTRPLAVATAVAAAVNVGLNLLVVPAWGLVGAAAATTVAFTVQAVLQRRALPPGLVWPRTPARLQVGLVGVAALAAASVLLPQDAGWIAVRTGLAALCIPWVLHGLRRARRAPAA
ncbi:lipopolysaccharide biosynthesis protein [Blastococcus tunisiensis]|uniref:Membrane protein involved in the export of O-antigen and teichoic acid n=1 Tax=Blastococcus tunisiensis TaxID=1798228 RepID=A0A1I2JEG7_9ACTN|nr:lipopolysaccharide biosynthesis protein [Blastococcus sp. DSM 46838]SFF51246.1 Membrane protein involved in the export of O-antigen and teichoic acid [Blastococcus sp. DSM 46838]